MLKLYTHNWPNFVCFHRGDLLQIVDFQIIFCCVRWTGGLVWWTTSWCFNGQLMYSCAITPYSTSNKRTLMTDSHVATLEFWLLSDFLVNWNTVRTHYFSRVYDFIVAQECKIWCRDSKALFILAPVRLI